MIRRVCGVALIAFAMIATVQARADPNEASKNFSLEWSVPPGCPSANDVSTRIQNLIVHAQKANEPVSARVRVSLEKNGHFSADVDVVGAASTRHLEGESCEGIADAVALIVAFAADPGEASQARAEPKPPTTNPKPLAPVPSSPKEDLSTTPNENINIGLNDNLSPRHVFFARAAGRADFGAAPSAVFGGELAVGWNPRHLELAITGALLSSSRAEVTGRSEGADINVADVGAHGCYAIFDSRWDVGPCAGGAARFLSAHGFGSAHPSDATALLGVVSFGVAGEAHVTPYFSARIDAIADVPLSRPTFEIDSTGVVYRAAPYAIHTTIGAQINF